MGIKEVSVNSHRTSVGILLAGLALGLAVERLFYGHALGISVPVFVLLALAALFGFGWQQGVRPAWRNLWLVTPLLFLAAMVAVRANPFLTFLNVTASLALLGLVAHFYGAGRLERLGLLGYPLTWLRTGGSALYRAAPLVGDALDQAALRDRGRAVLGPVLRGCLLALPVLLVFGALLASADLIFARYLADLLRLRFWQDLFWRGVVVVVVGWLLAGGLAYALGRSAQDGPGALDRVLGSVAGALNREAAAAGEDGLDGLLRALARVFRLGFVEAAIVLGALDLLFLAFVGVQFAYLFGGEANVSAQGFTYAEYVHRGFGELVAVAILTLGLILGLDWLAHRSSRAQTWAFNGLGSLMVGLVLVILGSAFQRMRLYELAYGFTELRLYVYVFMVWLGLALLWFLVSLWRLPGRFAVGALAATLGFLVTLNAINPDAFITRQNLARYRATGDLDVRYLTTLSEDATPLLLGAIDQVRGDQRTVLLDHLWERRQRMSQDTAWQGWPSLHLARRQAHALLEAWYRLHPYIWWPHSRR